MSNLILDPIALADAQVQLETVFGKKYVDHMQDRKNMIVSLEDSKYSEDIKRCERANEANYNATLKGIRSLRDNLGAVADVAKALAARDTKVTTDKGIDAETEVIDTTGILSM